MPRCDRLLDKRKAQVSTFNGRKRQGIKENNNTYLLFGHSRLKTNFPLARRYTP